MQACSIRGNYSWNRVSGCLVSWSLGCCVGSVCGYNRTVFRFIFLPREEPIFLDSSSNFNFPVSFSCRAPLKLLVILPLPTPRDPPSSFVIFSLRYVYLVCDQFLFPPTFKSNTRITSSISRNSEECNHSRIWPHRERVCNGQSMVRVR